MPEGDWRERRAELVEAIQQLLEEPGGIVLLVIFVILILGAMAVSGVLLWLLRRQTPAVSLPAPRWNGPDVLLFLFGWFILQLFLGSAMVSLFGTFPPNELGGLPDRLGRVPTVATAQIAAGSLGGLLVAAGIVLLPTLRGQPMTALGIGTGSVGRGLGQGALVWLCALPGGFALLFSWVYGLVLLGIEPDPQPVVDLFRENFQRGNWAPALAVMTFGIIVAPLVEELLFRSLVHRWLARRLGVRPAVVISGLLFGLVHGSLFALLPIAVLGMLLALVLERTGNVWSCVALHAIFNAGQFALMLLVGGLG